MFLDNKCLFYLNEMKNKPLNLGFLLILSHVAHARERYGLGGLAASKTAEHQDFKVLKSLFLDNKCLFYLNQMKNKPLNVGFLLILGHVAHARERCPLRI